MPSYAIPRSCQYQELNLAHTPYEGAALPSCSTGLVGSLGFEPRVRKRDGVTARRPFLQNIDPMILTWCGREDLNLHDIAVTGTSGQRIYRSATTAVFFWSPVFWWARRDLNSHARSSAWS